LERSNSFLYIDYGDGFSLAARGLVYKSLWKCLPNVSSFAPTRYFVNSGIDDFSAFQGKQKFLNKAHSFLQEIPTSVYTTLPRIYYLISVKTFERTSPST
jgi:hypothetical protein